MQVAASLPGLDLEAAARIVADDDWLKAKALPESVISGVHCIEADGLPSHLGLLDVVLDKCPALAE